jgi:predicted nucleic acid-binding protein
VKRMFVIDEDVFISAWTAEDDRGKLYWAPAQLMMNISANCHKVVLFSELQRKYFSHVEYLKRAGRTALLNIPVLLNQLMRNSEKITYLPEIIGVDLPACVKPDDAMIVRASIQTGAVLVTDDGPLLDCIHNNGLSTKFNLQAVRPRQAIQYSH